MADQNYNNHRRAVPGFHIVLSLLLFAGIVVSIVNIFRHPPHSGSFISSVLIALLFVCGLIMFWYIRKFPIAVQDRSIKAEETMRYFILTGKRLDSRLTIRQIIALRFADDDELVALVERALNENLTSTDIKKAIKNWRADHLRA